MFLLLNFLSITLVAQDFGQMYWQMRQRLLDKFIRVGNCHGCSIPATLLKIKGSDQNGLIQQDELYFQDESQRHMAWYVAVLATEHRLLTLQNKSTSENEKELYYALDAFNRLDRFGEYLRYNGELDTYNISSANTTWDNTTKQYGKILTHPIYNPYGPNNPNVNGYLIREDVPPFFEENFFPNENYKIRHNGEGGWILNNAFVANKKPSIISQDQFYHMMIGLAFVVRYIPETATYNGKFLKQMAKDICLRGMSRFNLDFHLIDPITNEVVKDADENPIGIGAIYSPLLIVAAKSIIDEEVFLDPTPQLYANQYYSSVVFAMKQLWDFNDFPNAPQTYAVQSISDANSIMPLLLISVSDALNYVTLPGLSGLILNMGADIGEYRNEGYKIYGNIYNLINERDNEDLGYNKTEMENMLGAMTCEGPHWNMELKSHFYDIGNYSQSNFENWFNSEVLPVIPADYVEKYTYDIDIPNDEIQVSSISYSWLKSQNPIWNRDNIFVQQPNSIETNYERNGHYNGIDYMLLHNIYNLSILEGKSGFNMSLPNLIYNAQFCGEDCYIGGTLPIVFPQNATVISEPVNCLYYFSPAEIGTTDHPLIRASLGTMTIGQDLSPLTLPLASNVITPQNQLTCDITIADKTYIPKVIYYATDGFDFAPDYDTNDLVYIDTYFANDNCPYTISARLSENSTSTKLHFNVIEREQIAGPINETRNTTSNIILNLIPNPSKETVQLNLFSNVEEEINVKIYSINGSAQQGFGNYHITEGENKIQLNTANLIAGVYSVVVGGKTFSKTLKMVKL